MTGARADVPVRAVITPFHRPSRAVPEADGHVDGAAARAWRPLLAWLGQLATCTLAWTIALWITHLLGFSWRA